MRTFSSPTTTDYSISNPTIPGYTPDYPENSWMIVLYVLIVVLCWVVFLLWWNRNELKDRLDRFRARRGPIYQVPSRPVPRNREERSKYDEEFRTISQQDIHLTCNTAQNPENTSKNRYRDIIPYDVNRIVLHRTKGGNYINASKVGNSFIATQDPLPDQDEDFWLMLWQNNVSIIIRLSSDSVEFPMAQYLPDIVNDAWVFGSDEIQVKNVSIHHLGDTRVTNVEVNKDGLIRHVVQFHLTSWRTGSIPIVKDVLQLVTSAQLARHKLDGNVAVHCGAGAGRTGTIIALWLITDGIATNEMHDPNVFNIVSGLRYERPGMVQTADQYAFLYKCKKHFTENRYLYPATDVLKLLTFGDEYLQSTHK